MRVNPNSEIQSPTGIPGKAPAKGPGLGQDQLASPSADALRAALASTPEVRPDKVAQATGMVQDVSYPPLELIHKISALLAIPLSNLSTSQST
jgi:hypothetical protein